MELDGIDDPDAAQNQLLGMGDYRSPSLVRAAATGCVTRS